MATDSIDLYEMADEVFERLGKSRYRDLVELDQVFVSVWSLKGEVDNGGFYQWLFNSSGDWAFDTPRALELIGATKTARLVEDAIRLFPGGSVPEDIEVRRKAMENLDENITQRWRDLDDIFYKEEEDIDSLLVKYVSSN